MPLRFVALEPERKVGSTAVSPGFPLARICSQLPAGGDPDLRFRVEGLPETHQTPQEKPNMKQEICLLPLNQIVIADSIVY